MHNSNNVKENLSVSLSGLKNFDAILICGYGGPRRPEDVIPFMRNATQGRGIPEERLAQVGEHYQIFGGMSPINAHIASLRRALEKEIRERGVDIEVVVGNRNWTPYFYDMLCDLAKQGKTRILCVFAAAYVCYSCCRQYREDLAKAKSEIAGQGLEVSFDKIRAFANTNGFITANAELLVQALRAEPYIESDRYHICFVTHSIPQAMEECSGNVHGGPSYKQQHLEVCSEVVQRAEKILKVDYPKLKITWDLSFCSRSGSPYTRWLEPDIKDKLTELSEQGVKQVLVSPIGFICDHMEVLFDLDTEAAATAKDLGIGFRRVPTVGVDEKFVAGLADLVMERDGQLDLSQAQWGRPVLAYVWPAWPLSDEQRASLTAPQIPAVMQIDKRCIDN